MRAFHFLLLLTSLTISAQNVVDTNLAYKKRTLNERNIVRINYDTSNNKSYQLLIKEKELKQDIIKFFAPHLIISSLSKDIIEITEYNHEYYFLFKTPSYNIVSLAHLVYIPRINVEFLIISNNHCVTPSNSTVCYPKSDGVNCTDRQLNCVKINTKK
jgi:hypothetical protein